MQDATLKATNSSVNDQHLTSQYSTPQHSDSMKKSFTLVLKILLLSVLPIILLTGLNLYTKSQSDNLFVEVTENRAEERVKSDRIYETKDSVKNASIEILSAISMASQNHQNGLLARNSGSVKKTLELLSSVPTKYRVFKDEVLKFAQVTEDSEFLDIPEDANYVDSAAQDRATSRKRLAFLLRSTSALENFLTQYEESNQRTIDLLKAKNYDAAINNYIFEEDSRIIALEIRLDKIIHQLNILSEELNQYSHEHNDYLTEQTNAQLGFLSWVNLILQIVVVAGLLSVVVFFSRTQIERPLKNITFAMRDLSGGNLEVDIPPASNDEIGDMAGALSVFKNNLIQTKELQEKQSKQQQIELEKAKKLGNIVKNFEGKATEAVSMFSSSSGDMLNAAQQLEHSVSTSQKTSENVRSASGEAMQNVETVAESVNQMSEAIHEIASQISKTQDVIAKSVEKTQNADDETARLSEATDKIGEIVTLIQDIAEQTNLLALNATIEAARAGEAGKGFAVVANEVKSLANQTAEAIEEISNNILEVQDISKTVISAIQSIRESIEQVSHSSSTVASAVEEQSSVTNSISTSMKSASGSVQDITQNMAEFARAIELVQDIAGTVTQSSNNLSEQASSLDGEIKTFCSDVSDV